MITIETLHLPTAIVQIELAALNKMGTIKAAAKELGVSYETLRSHIYCSNIVREPRTKVYTIKPSAA